MTNKIPKITVKSEIKKVDNTNPLIKDVVCLIGGFEDDKTVNTPTFCSTLTEAEKTFGDDDTIDANLALKQIFREDITGCLIVNVTTSTGSGDNINYQRNVTKTKLLEALATVNLIDFDLLYIASELTDELIVELDGFCGNRFENKRPCGYIGAGSRASAAAYITTSEKLGDWCYAFLTQPVIIGEDTLSLIESGAYLTNTIATLPVGNSLTAKILDEVTGLVTDYTFKEDDLGLKLVENGFFVIRLTDALNDSYECVNSAGPNGLDLYVSRVRDYIVNEFALRDFLGERNNSVTMDLIGLECARIYNQFKEELALIEDMAYTIEKEDATTVNVIITELDFNGVITDLNVFITIEVE